VPEKGGEVGKKTALENLFVISSHMGALNSVNEWFVDTATWMLYVWAPGGTNPEGRVGVKTHDLCIDGVGWAADYSEGRDGIVATPRDGIVATPRDGIVATPRDGIVATPRDGIVATPKGDGIVATPSASGHGHGEASEKGRHENAPTAATAAGATAAGVTPDRTRATSHRPVPVHISNMSMFGCTFRYAQYTIHYTRYTMHFTDTIGLDTLCNQHSMYVLHC
jgi:hypothetical protein